MSEIRQELLQELLRRLHARNDEADRSIRDLRTDNIALRRLVAAQQVDISNLHELIHNLEERLSRTERRLDLREFSEAAQADYLTD
ncbi:SMC interacting uncharacterized protein involved in chromosome segregation [Rhizobium aquaticum]|uniref:SMC interacting uncharacterized protein involved in chromosome segregation n=1 Tax=Rhizobium aquaticum TaxID=1549636 RepID=A0ABV2IWP8_9HYPH